jgi:type I restriction enzyme S subunit
VSKEWLHETTLDDVLERVMGGGTPSRDIPEYYTGNIPWATVKDIKSTKIFDTLEHVTEEAISKSASNVVPKGTIVMATRMAVGKCFEAMNDMAINQDLKALMTKPNTLSSHYLLQWLQLNKEKIESMGTGTTVKGIRLEQIRSMTISLPPLPEQRKIVAILTSVDDAIEKTEAIIKQTEKVKTALMQQLLTKGIGHTEFKQTEIGEIPLDWHIDRIGGISPRVCVGFVGSINSYYTEKPYGVVLLRTGNISNDGLDLNDVKYVTREFHEKNKKSQLSPGDLIISRHGDSGSARVIPDSLTESNCLNVVVIKKSDVVNSQFMSYLFNSGITKNILLKTKAGSVQGVVNTKEIEQVLIPIPPIEEQKRIVDVITSIDNKLFSENFYSSSLFNLKTSLMQSLLTGKVRVNIEQTSEVLV